MSPLVFKVVLTFSQSSVIGNGVSASLMIEEPVFLLKSYRISCFFYLWYLLIWIPMPSLLVAYVISLLAIIGMFPVVFTYDIYSDSNGVAVCGFMVLEVTPRSSLFLVQLVCFVNGNTGVGGVLRRSCWSC